MSTTEHTRPLLTQRTRRKLHKLLEAVVPEQRFYITSAPFDVTGVCCNAFTPDGPLRGALYEKIVAEYSGWQGDGQVIVITNRLDRHKIRGTILHEASHPTIATQPIETLSPELQLMEAEFMRINSTHRSIGDAPVMPNWYRHHGIEFIRRATHLHFRAWRAGYDVGLPMMNVAGWGYDLSPAWLYRRALGDEPRRMWEATLAEITAAPVPIDFQDLFVTDLIAWMKRQSAISITEGEPNVCAA
jgi:hypothetical protein